LSAFADAVRVPRRGRGAHGGGGRRGAAPGGGPRQPSPRTAPHLVPGLANARAATFDPTRRRDLYKYMDP
jgi:hypothetical protein